MVRVAAVGDVHSGGPGDDRLGSAFAEADRETDLILLAGDLTLHGKPEEAVPLVEAVRGLETPVVAVLGNHDWHANRIEELVATLREGGVRVLVRESVVLEVAGTQVGIAGVKGFVGGFPDSELPDFGEPTLRRVYAETTAEVEALDRGLAAIAACPIRIALLHYAPTTTTLEGFIGEVPVYNVAQTVIGRDYWIFELESSYAG